VSGEKIKQIVRCFFLFENGAYILSTPTVIDLPQGYLVGILEDIAMEPLTILSASAIAQLAFDEFIKSSAGELAKKSLSGTIDLAKDLRNKIRARFKGEDEAEAALIEVEQQGNTSALDKLAKYLDAKMIEDKPFANEIRQIAQQIINIHQNTTTTNREYKNFGRDLYTIENLNGNPKLGGS
jgi:hypothetical protein